MHLRFHTSIPITQAPIFSSLDRAIADHAPHVASFLPPRLTVQSLQEKVHEIAGSYKHRQVLMDLISEQYHAQGLPHVLENNIRLLSKQNTYCIVTAHQPLLLGGTGYFLYKALSVIALADWANKQITEANFVPVFVLGSEDHDFEEVRHTAIYHEELIWESEAGGAAGRMGLGNIPELIQRVNEILKGHPHADYVEGILQKSYTGATSFGQGTFLFLHHLLGELGLIVLDPDRSIAKWAFLPVIEKELTMQFSKPAVDIISLQMQERGLKVQAKGRALNLFYLQKNRRTRIDKIAPDLFRTVDNDLSWTLKEILSEAHDFPERFSPNVILRPLYQQTLLPCCLFVGGGGELAYWMELGAVFKAADLVYPLVRRRDSVWILDHIASQKMDKFGLSVMDLMRDQEEVIKSYVVSHSHDVPEFDAEVSHIQTELNSLIKKASYIDPGLGRTCEAMATGIHKQLEGLLQKRTKMLMSKADQDVQQLRNMFSRLFPQGGLQERKINFLPFLAQFGPNMIQTILQQIKAEEPGLHCFYYDVND